MKATSVSMLLRIFLFAFKLPNTKRAYIKTDSMISAIFIIDICIDNHPFKVFINKKEEGVGDLKCGKVRVTN